MKYIQPETTYIKLELSNIVMGSEKGIVDPSINKAWILQLIKAKMPETATLVWPKAHGTLVNLTIIFGQSPRVFGTNKT